MEVFPGWKIIPAIALILISLILYPFAGLAIFLLVFMAEVLAKMRMKIPEERRMEKANLCHTSSAAQSL